MDAPARTVLVVMPSVPAIPGTDSIFMDIKMVEGLVRYAALWDGPVRCLAREGRGGEIGYGQSYAPASLPFEVGFIAHDAHDVGPWLEDAAVVLAAGDNHQDFAVVEHTDVPVVYIIEYTLGTRLRIIGLDRGKSLRALKSVLWTLNSERRRRRAFAASAGLQANGQPAFDAYRSDLPSTMRYFDSRMSDAQQIEPAALAAKQSAIRAGRPLRLAFSGRLERMKGADHLVPVAVELRRRGLAFEFDIFGSGALHASMREAIDAAGLGDAVRLRGAVPFDAELVPALKQRIDLFVCCHRQADPSCTYLETLSCGVPIVGYDNAAFTGVLALGRAGIATPMDDVDAIAAAVAQLDADRETLAAMAEAAAAIGREHSFDRTFDSRIAHLRTVAAR